MTCALQHLTQDLEHGDLVIDAQDPCHVQQIRFSKYAAQPPACLDHNTAVREATQQPTLLRITDRPRCPYHASRFPFSYTGSCETCRPRSVASRMPGSMPQ